MSQIILQFSTERAISSWLIRWFTWSDWSHIDIALDDGTLLGARSDGGVQIRPANYAAFSKTVRYSVDCTEEQEARFMEAATSQIGTPYNFLGLLNFMFHRDWRKTTDWFCSELVAWCFEQAGLPLLNPVVPVQRITPQDVLLSCRMRSM